ncbi:MAG: sugar transferase/glycosyl transferase, WecB/TagA/CpsF family protein [uncultured bacterium]|nr:MAG: sugar transferase/glycosyl transferase, WecB/TagA/CpsF family protein [uncultured bacterium]
MELISILGIPVVWLRLREISPLIANLLEERGKVRSPGILDKKIIFYVDAYHFNIANKDSFYKKILQTATFVHASGMGPVLASKMLGSPLPERTPTPDFIEEIFTIAEKKKWSFYLLGGEKDVVEKTVQNLRKKFPGLKIAGYHHGFFTNNNKIVEEINRAKPDIVLVGMGPPKQEKWIEENKDKINAKVFWAVGALFDILSGKRKRAPNWMQDLGLEWAYRVGQEPKRLWRRYIFGNIEFLFIVLKERVAFFHKSSH